MTNKILPVCLFFCALLPLALQSQVYMAPKELNKQFENLAAQNKSRVKIHQIATSPGNNMVIVAEIGKETSQNAKIKPAIFVLANADGLNPLSSFASLVLANNILKNKHLDEYTWYILPCLNPDASENFFAKTKWENPRNHEIVNDDQDDATDEDNPDDLNKDGFITQMRVKDPLGTWIVDEKEPRLMRKANTLKSEKGVYTIYTEGIDNDNDGLYNEDYGGGTNPGINFPHLFKPFTPDGGKWPGSTPEVYAVMEFIYDHPEIAACFTLGSSDYCRTPPEGGRKGDVDYDNIRIPDDLVAMLGAEKGKTYKMDEIIEMAKPLAPPGVELDASEVASFLGLGAVVNPLPDDLAWYKELSEQYALHLKKANFNPERLEAPKAKDGSFELWSYYHLGIPSFSMNFFTIPKSKPEKKETSGLLPEKIGTMSKDELIGLGEEKIDAFLKENNVPEQFTGKGIIEKLNSGSLTPAQMGEMLKNMPPKVKTGEPDEIAKATLEFSDKYLQGKGFAKWQPYKHPTLGDVEIGGFIPFVNNTPPVDWADSLINVQMPWIFQLVEKLPRLKIDSVHTKSLGANVYSIDLWIENQGYIPFPTAMGVRNGNPAPCILRFETENIEYLTGNPRTTIKSIGGLKSEKYTFILKVNSGNQIKVKLESKFAGNDELEIKI